MRTLAISAAMFAAGFVTARLLQHLALVIVRSIPDAHARLIRRLEIEVQHERNLYEDRKQNPIRFDR